MFFDIPQHTNFFFQDEASKAMSLIVEFHHDVMFFLALVFGFTLFILARIIYLFTLTGPIAAFRRKQNQHRTEVYVLLQEFSAVTILEVVWTVIPMLILFFIAYPSIALIYKIDTLLDPRFTLKVIGHQWYWSYETADFHYFYGEAGGFGTYEPQIITSSDWKIDSVEFDAYMVPTEDLHFGDFRLLETTEAVFLPVDLNIRLLVTSSDVLHSWAVPSLGVKVDAVPGRLNQAVTSAFRLGTYYGQCSEICGVNHGFMPIKVCVVDQYEFEVSSLAKL
jgi:cytochrome c oxidase subunit 2